MREGCLILYPGLEDQPRALSYPRKKADVNYILANTSRIHNAWIEQRKEGIGASSAGAVNGTGYSSKDTPLHVYQLHLGLVPPDPENYSMEVGHLLEPVVADKFCSMTGCIQDEGSAVDFFAIDKSQPFLRVSPDRFVWEPETPAAQRTLENAVILECKTCSHPIDPEDIPDYWYCQCQYQMGVFGADYCYISWFNLKFRPDENPFGYKKIDFNPGFYANLKSKIVVLWQHITDRIPPAPINGRDARSLYGRELAGAKIACDETALELIRQYLVAKDDEARAKKEKEDAQSALELIMRDNEKMIFANKDAVTWKASKDSVSFDMDRFKEEQPEIYDSYCQVKKGSRSFRVKLRVEDLVVDVSSQME